MKTKGTYDLFRCIAGSYLMVVLLWLTVSTPFVNSFQEKMSAIETGIAEAGGDEDGNNGDYNPFSNTTEEKTESGPTTFSEEYVHEFHDYTDEFADLLRHGKCSHTDIYITFHGELLSPPPEV